MSTQDAEKYARTLRYAGSMGTTPAERRQYLKEMGYDFPEPVRHYTDLALLTGAINVLQMIANCQADSQGRVTLGSYEMDKIRGVLKAVQS